MKTLPRYSPEERAAARLEAHHLLAELSLADLLEIAVNHLAADLLAGDVLLDQTEPGA